MVDAEAAQEPLVQHQPLGGGECGLATPGGLAISYMLSPTKRLAGVADQFADTRDRLRTVCGHQTINVTTKLASGTRVTVNLGGLFSRTPVTAKDDSRTLDGQCDRQADFADTGDRQGRFADTRRAM